MKIENSLIKNNKMYSVDVDGVNIKVINKKYVCLYVNDQLQDIHWGLFVNSSVLKGKMPDGREIKVCFGGHFIIQFAIFVDNNLVLNSYKKLDKLKM